MKRAEVKNVGKLKIWKLGKVVMKYPLVNGTSKHAKGWTDL